jgi:alpha-L-arabinofuranosidase
MAEAIYFTTIIHECIRLGDLIEMFTHSATVNHGGGLRKYRERSFGNPVHYAHVMSVPLMNGTPVAVELSSAAYSTKTAFSNIPPLENVPAIDAMAVLSSSSNELVVMLVHRAATTGAIQLSLNTKGFSAAKDAELLTMADEVPYGANTYEQPERITPKKSSVRVAEGRVALTLPAYSVSRLTLKKG